MGWPGKAVELVAVAGVVELSIVTTAMFVVEVELGNESVGVAPGR